jgi:hypothetical protein
MASSTFDESATRIPTSAAMSLMGPACVKTRASRECAELFSPFSSFDCDCQCCSFPIQRNRDKLSTRKFDVGVFTQAGSFATEIVGPCHVRSAPDSDQRADLPVRQLRANPGQSEMDHSRSRNSIRRAVPSRFSAISLGAHGFSTAIPQRCRTLNGKWSSFKRLSELIGDTTTQSACFSMPAKVFANE